MSQNIRCFIAVDVDCPPTLDRVRVIQKTLRDTGADLKLVEPSNIHFTLRFLGDVPPSIVDEICKRLTTVGFNPFNLHLKGLGVFPHRRHINVVWTAISEGQEQLHNVYNEIQGKLTGLPLRADDRGFSPHLTLARVRSPRNRDRLIALLDEMVDCDVGVQSVSVVRLKRSVLTPQGPIYSLLCESRIE